MEDLKSVHQNPPKAPFDDNERADWEDWEDDEPVTPINMMDNSLVATASSKTSPNSSPSRPHDSKTRRPLDQRLSKARQSAHKVQRLKSRKRQKAQNAKAGIKVITDMTALRKGPQHVAQLVRPDPTPVDERMGKFVDANALRALEGEPSSASVGNWAWLKKKPSAKNDKQKPLQSQPGEPQLSPSDNKIVIGISMPEDDVVDRIISPQTAVVASPMDRLPVNPPSLPPPQQLESSWSPDTDEGFSPSQYSRAASSVYSPAPGNSTVSANAPPVPVLPSYFAKTKANATRNEIDDDDNFTPVTLFEEDGGKSPSLAASKLPPEVARLRSGWWDHVKTPFKERCSPIDARSRMEEETSPAADEWWNGKDEKTALSQLPVPVIHEPTPTIASSSRSSPRIPDSRPETHAENAVVMEESDFSTDLPPTYEQASKQPVRYRAVFPPGHPLVSQFPPSPGAISPGLAGTMTSQGAINMTEVPLTPSGFRVPMHDRPVGSFVTGEHFASARGDSPQARVERQRRRHEKEEYFARKVGGWWKGRGCLPASGCYGRAGREGRKRRRIYLGGCIGLLLLVALAVTLGVVLSRRVISHTPIDTVWLNLTGFPPIPTGISTVVGPDNSDTVVGCTSPTTFWSCSLPPEQQAANAPYEADQPKFIFQIQYDNNTRQLWNIPNGVPPIPTGTTTITTATAMPTSTSASAMSTNDKNNVPMSSTNAGKNSDNGDNGDNGDNDLFLSKRSDILYDAGFAPSPEPPSFAEMWFLGNTSDGIVSDQKAGEPTPFYISFFDNLNQTAGPNMLQRKRGTGNGISSGSDSDNTLAELLPPPELNADGTGAAAQLRPYPYQQPLRLFDRGLPTEHYGFYSYYNKTTYIQSIVAAADGTSTSSSDKDGGSLQTESQYLATWSQARFIVKIWTRLENSTRLLGGGGSTPSSAPSSGVAPATNNTMPGTFPYPITIGLDTHGGNRDLKASYLYGVEPDLHINTTEARLIANFQAFGGSRINPSSDPDMSYGGVDGGNGGCKCSWINFLNVNSS